MNGSHTCETVLQFPPSAQQIWCWFPHAVDSLRFFQRMNWPLFKMQEVAKLIHEGWKQAVPDNTLGDCGPGSLAFSYGFFDSFFFLGS
jgi:hypothetical protein